ncbi:hypothetical protein K2173_023840 [Erythroxylum novogranatense]|uniref:DUF4283 domain-containing protein n=1 Tax=Erythroxylum novogranatense TaxID=1862640 RepID=A0AAV8TKW7_9ROSI|nr:hypothetical protein K2173_023840 [Erythroxylum novogranatense]
MSTPPPKTSRASIRPDNPRNSKKSRPPDKPPDLATVSSADNVPARDPASSPIHVPSYQDKLLGKLAQVKDSPKVAPVDLLASKVMTMSFRNDDVLCPEFTIDTQYKQNLMSPWQQALVVKVLGRSVGYRVLYTRLYQMWKPKGELDILDLGYDYFLIKFTLEEDRTHVLTNGPWMIQGYYLTDAAPRADRNTPQRKATATAEDGLVDDGTSLGPRFGEWMVVDRHPRHVSRPQHATNPQGNTQREYQNLFQALNEKISEPVEAATRFQVGIQDCAEPSHRQALRQFKSRANKLIEPAVPAQSLRFRHTTTPGAHPQTVQPHANHAENNKRFIPPKAPTSTVDGEVTMKLVKSLAGSLQQVFSSAAHMTAPQGSHTPTPPPTPGLGEPPDTGGQGQVTSAVESLESVVPQLSTAIMELDPPLILDNSQKIDMAVEDGGAPQTLWDVQ